MMIEFDQEQTFGDDAKKKHSYTNMHVCIAYPVVRFYMKERIQKSMKRKIVYEFIYLFLIFSLINLTIAIDTGEVN